ncbi:MAG: hypothetical protein JXJ30_10860 [Halothiobacillaceae bacterium]|nr:hypothetical protein [Halothiobacillaceae bacterium]HER34022.1 hypothetical protein [Halothiobacillaceae bacterium]
MTLSETRRILAHWTPDAADPVFAGHFPGDPLLPGALMVDWAVTSFQTQLGSPAAPGAIRQAKFPSPARPGVPLVLTSETAPRGRTRLTVSHADGHEPRIVMELLIDAASCTSAMPGDES